MCLFTPVGIPVAHPPACLVPAPPAPPLQAHKRGLDVEKLNGNRTPAWRNLRGRDGAAKKQSYFEGPEDEEDELADQPSDGEAAAGKKGKRSRAAAAVQEEDEDEDEDEEALR